MRWSLMGSLIVSLGGLIARAPGADVIASAPRTPGQGGQPVAIAQPATSSRAPLVTLGRPRAIRGVAADANPALMPISHLDAPVLRPVPSPYAPREQPVAEDPEAEEPSGFAVERVGYTEPPAVGGVGATPPANAVPIPAPSRTAPETGPFGPTFGGYYHTPTEGMEAGYGEGGDFVSAGGPSSRFYASAEYLAWWTKDAGVPPLATTSVSPTSFGFLNDPNTRILFAGPLDREVQHGARFRGGYWLDTCKPMAIEGSFFFLSARDDNFVATSDGSQVITRPFFNINQGIEFGQPVATPLAASGTLLINAPSRFLGADANVRCPLCCSQCCDTGFNFDLLGGFRYLNLSEGLYVTEFGTGIAPLIPAGGMVVTNITPGTTFRVDDRFDTRNRFYGGQVGLDTELREGRWSFGVRSTIALGVSHQTLNISGSSVQTPPGGLTMPSVGGLLAIPPNFGQFTQDRFAVVPEVGLKLGYQFTDALRVTGGYNFLYWSSVLRPGDQIDRNIDINRIPGFVPPNVVIPPAPFAGPQPQLKESDYWAQGFNLGLEVRW